jgi:hypothetical protein
MARPSLKSDTPSSEKIHRDTRNLWKHRCRSAHCQSRAASMRHGAITARSIIASGPAVSSPGAAKICRLTGRIGARGGKGFSSLAIRRRPERACGPRQPVRRGWSPFSPSTGRGTAGGHPSNLLRKPARPRTCEYAANSKGPASYMSRAICRSATSGHTWCLLSAGRRSEWH